MVVNKFMETDFEKMVKSFKLSPEKVSEIYDFLDASRKKVDSHERVSSMEYENKFYEITNSEERNHYEPEEFLFECAKEDRYRELYVHFYRGMAKHDVRIKRHNLDE